MNYMVAVFFLFVTACLLISGALLPRRVASRAGQHFGGGLIATGLAFAIWSYAVIGQMEAELSMFVWAGLIVLMLGTLLFASAATADRGQTAQEMAVLVTFIFAVILAVVRLTYPSAPGFSEQGLFFFNPHPVVQFLEILLLSATILPAALVVSRHFRQPFPGQVFLTSLVAIHLGALVLITSIDETLLWLIGWELGVASLLLVMTAIGLFEHTEKTVSAPAVANSVVTAAKKRKK